MSEIVTETNHLPSMGHVTISTYTAPDGEAWANVVLTSDYAQLPAAELDRMCREWMDYRVRRMHRERRL